jgi:hypothetical protein
VPTNHHTERLGIYRVGELAEAAGWFFREQPRPDRGIDAHVEGSTGGLPDGRLIALQIKSGTSYFGDPVEGGWRRYLDSDHVAYWLAHSLPVVLVLHDPTSGDAYWQVVRGETLRPTPTQFAIEVLANQRFGVPMRQTLAALAEQALPQDAESRVSALRGRRLELDIPLMELLERGGRLFLEAEQSLDGPPGQGALRLIAEDPSGHSRVEHDWPWAFLAGADYAAQLRGLFPWADKQIDHERYRREAYPLFVARHGTWSEAEGYEFDGDFDTWFAADYAGRLVPYATNVDQTAALWRLELCLNHLGRATLAEDKRMMWEEVQRDDALDRELEAGRAASRYTGEVVEDARGGFFENVVFDAGDWGRSLLMERQVWTDPAQLSRVATVILRDARGTMPTRGLVEAFIARFRVVFAENDGDSWEMTAAELREWLDELCPPR